MDTVRVKMETNKRKLVSLMLLKPIKLSRASLYLLLVFVLTALSCAATIAMFFGQRSSAASTNADLEPSISERPQRISLVHQRVLLVEDPVCKRTVDPSDAPCVLDLGTTAVYFHSRECLEIFRASHSTDRLALAPADSIPSDAGKQNPSDELVPGGPPEPLDETAGRDAPRSSSLDEDPPVGATPPTLAPEPPLEQGAPPTPQSVDDAPSVAEKYPESSLPTDLPKAAPHVPDLGPESKSTTTDSKALEPPKQSRKSSVKAKPKVKIAKKKTNKSTRTAQSPSKKLKASKASANAKRIAASKARSKKSKAVAKPKQQVQRNNTTQSASHAVKPTGYAKSSGSDGTSNTTRAPKSMRAPAGTPVPDITEEYPPSATETEEL